MLKKVISRGRGLAFLLAVAGSCYCQTTFLADFDDGYDAAFAAGNPAALFGIRFPEGGANLVEGRFGKGLFLEKKVGNFQFGYETNGNFRHERGTVEFWFRPEWDSDYRDPEGPAWWKGGSLYTLFSTLEAPTGFRLQKNHTNYLSYHYIYNYKQYASVGLAGKFWSKGDWVHLAASWDQNEGRLFINGRLVAVSDAWQPSTPYEYRMYLSGWGTYDDFRVSDGKIYVSSFPVPDKPLTAEREKKEAVLPPLAGEERALMEKDRVIFYVNFEEGFTPGISAGAGNFITNRPLPDGQFRGSSGLRMKRTGAVPETTLCYPAEKNINRFLGTAELVFKLSEETFLPAVLLDMSEIEQQTTASPHRRTGMRLLLNKDRSVEWQNLLDGTPVASVRSGPLQMNKDEWNSVGCSWKPSSVSLFHNQALLVEKKEIPLPVKLANYIFIGSDSLAQENLDGWVKEVKIMLKYRGER